MRHLTFEGGFYGIYADSGGHYRPVNLPVGFAEDGIRVRFCAQPLEGVMSSRMWGIPVEIVKIESLGADGRAAKEATEGHVGKPRNHWP
jgi:hypothetical protein